MPLFQDTAIVLRRLDYSETSQVMAVFTRGQGQIRLIARGIKRSTKARVAVGLDLLEYGDLTYSMRPDKPDVLATLTEWRQRDHFPGLRRDLVRSYAGQYAAEATSRLTESHDPHPELFDALLRLLRDLGGGDPVGRLAAYVWVLLVEIGLRPELDECVGCRREVEGEAVVYYSAREGGILCRDCEPARVEKRRVDGRVLRHLSQIGDSRAPAANGDIGEHDAETFHANGATGLAVLELLDYHLTELLSGPPRLSAALRAAIGATPKARP